METKDMPPRKHVVIGYDFSAPAEVALGRGIELACRAPWHALHVVAAIDDAHPLRAKEGRHVDWKHAEQVEHAVFDRVGLAFAEREALGDVHFYVHARLGKAAEEILDLAREISADLIIIGAHGHGGVGRMLFGSVSEQVVRHACCPVLVSRPKTYEQVELIDVVEAKADDPKHRKYVRPHRYSYTDSAILTRSNDWPL